MSGRIFTVRVWMNCDRDNFDGYQPTHPLASSGDLELRIFAESANDAAEGAFAVGNRQGSDEDGSQWPSDVRSVSVGDLLSVKSDGGPQVHLAVAKAGWLYVPEPVNPRVPLAGQDRVTSRTEEQR